MNILQVYGKLYDRFDTSKVQFEVEQELVLAVLSIPGDDVDAYLDQLDNAEDIGSALDCFLRALVLSIDTAEHEKALRGEDFFVFSEEAGFGVAPTLKDAKVAWVDGEY